MWGASSHCCRLVIVAILILHLQINSSNHNKQLASQVQCFSPPSALSSPPKTLNIQELANYTTTNQQLINSSQKQSLPPEADRAASTISMRIKTFQVSACNGEQLSFRCNDDYLIDVMTVAYTVLKPPPPTATAAATDDDDMIVKHQQANSGQQLDTRVRKPIESLTSPDGGPPLPLPGDWEAAGSMVMKNYSTTCAPILPDLSNETAPICNEQQAARATEANREMVFETVKQECHLRKSCSLNLKQQPANASGNPIETPSSSSSDVNNQGKRANSASLKLIKLNEACPANRKVLEIVYKCRPQKMGLRHYCRGQQMQLDCPQGKRIVVGLLRYGSVANETKMHKRCLELPWSSSSLSPASSEVTPPAPSTQTQTQVAPLNATTYRDCSVADESEQVKNQCLFKQHCRLDVQPSLLGHSNCPAGQPEWLKVMYICLSQDLMAGVDLPTARSNSSNTTTTTTTLLTKSAPPMNHELSFRGQSSSSPPFLLLAGQPLAPISANSNSNSQMAQNDQQTNYHTTLETTDLAEPTSLFSLQHNIINSSIHTPAASDPNLARQQPQQQHPKLLSPAQEVGFLLGRYQAQLLAFACFSLSALLLTALMVRGCQRLAFTSSRRSNSSSSNWAKSSRQSCGSSKSSSASSSASSGSAGGGCHHAHSATTLSAAGGAPQASTPQQLASLTVQQQQQQHNSSKHNSCSESCFSLEATDFQIGGGASHSSSNHSPALDSVDGGGRFMQQTASAAARPKLWSIYGINGQQQHLRSSAAAHQHHQTLNRPNRTFLGLPAAPPQLNQQQQHLAPLQTSELLLALANASQQQQNQQAAAAVNPNWYANLQQQQQQPLPISRAHPIPHPLPQQNHNQHHHHHLVNPSVNEELQQFQAGQQHCAFHQQQLQQHLYGSAALPLPPPPQPQTIQLAESMAPAPTGDLVISISQQQQQFEPPQHFALLQVQQQQQQQQQQT